MSKLMLDVANEICAWDAPLELNEWFFSEIYDLAIRFPGLDEIPKCSVFLLSQLAANGPLDENALAVKASLKLTEVYSGIEALEERAFVKACNSKYEATGLGYNAFCEIGRNLIIRKRLEMKLIFERLDCLYKVADQLP